MLEYVRFFTYDGSAIHLVFLGVDGVMIHHRSGHTRNCMCTNKLYSGWLGSDRDEGRGKLR